VVPLRGATLSWDQFPAMDYQKKCYRDVLITARGNLYEKILAAPSVGRTMDISVMYGAQSKKKFMQPFFFPNILIGYMTIVKQKPGHRAR
jgi:hypothetical protein